MKIGFDVSQTGSLKAGCGYFADSLIRTLAEIDHENQYILYPTFGNDFWDPNWAAESCQINRPNFKRGLVNRSYEVNQDFWSFPPSDWEAQLGQPDIIHSNNFYCPVGLRSARLVYTLYDLAFLIHPEWTTEANRIACFNGVFNASLNADWIISISEHTKKNFLEIFPHYPVDRISVIYPASRFTYQPNLHRPSTLSMLLPEKFWLTVGTIEPRKNHRRLLEAYARLKADIGQSLPLVIAGGKGWLTENFEQWIVEMGLQENVIWLKYVDDVELQWLYQNCFTFVYPSLFEGFGMPVVEAISLGAPVLTSSCTSLLEIVKRPEQLFSPLDISSIINVMLRIYQSDDFRQHTKSYSLSQGFGFSWSFAAKSVLECYQLAAG